MRIKFRIFVYISYVPEQFGIVQTIASRELLGKYTLPPWVFNPTRTMLDGVSFVFILPFMFGSKGWFVGLTTARICILRSFPELLLDDVALCFKIPGLGSVPILNQYTFGNWFNGLVQNYFHPRPFIICIRKWNYLSIVDILEFIEMLDSRGGCLCCACNMFSLLWLFLIKPVV